MKSHPETSPLSKRFERCPRMAQECCMRYFESGLKLLESLMKVATASEGKVSLEAVIKQFYDRLVAAGKPKKVPSSPACASS